VELKVADVKSNGFCFSDGVGYISKEMSQYVAKKMGYTQASAY